MVNKSQKIDITSEENKKLIQIASKIIKKHKKAFEVLGNG